MSRRIALSSCVLAILVGCSGADEGVTKTTTGRGGSTNTGSGGSAGSTTTGSGGNGGSTGGTTGTGGSTGGTGGTGGATGGTGGATGGTGGATGGTGGATGGTGGATGGAAGATGGTGGATGGAAGATGGAAGATGGTGGATGGAAGSGGSAGAKDGGAGTGGTAGAAGSGGTGGTGTTDGGALGTSKCGAPLFGADPTTASLGKDGSLTVAASYAGPTSADYGSLTIYYPSNGTGPYVMIAYAMGLTETGSLFSGWAKRMASNGYVVGVVDAINTNNSGEDRAKGQWTALQNMKAENTKSGSPLMGKLSNCMVTSGHSLGGGAAIKTGNDHPADIKGVIGLNPFNLSQGFSAIVAPTLIITGELDDVAVPSMHGKVAYDGIPASTMKEYAEISGGNHQSALSVNATTGQYAVAWMKYEVDGDVRYKPFLDKLASGLSSFFTTVK